MTSEKNAAVGRDTPGSADATHMGADEHYGRRFAAEAPAGTLSIAAAGAAVFSFLSLLACGAILVLGAKLQLPDLGAGASPWSVLRVIVVVSLGILGVPVELGELEVGLLPLGAVLFAGVMSVWGIRGFLFAAARRLADRSDVQEKDGEKSRRASVGARLRTPLLVGGLLGSLCGAASVLSSAAGGGSGELSTRPLAALVAGTFWGTAWSLVALTRSDPKKILQWLTGSATDPDPVRSAVMEGIRLAARVTALSLIAALAFAVTRVAGDASLAAGLGSSIHALALAPNLAAAASTLALGAEVHAGTGGPITSIESAPPPAYALMDWNRVEAPAAAWLLVLIPLVCILATGASMAMGRRDQSGGTSRRLHPWGAMVITGLAFAIVMALLAAAGEARAVLDLEGGGWATVAPNPRQVLLLGLGWATVGLPLGWALGRLVRRSANQDAPR